MLDFARQNFTREQEKYASLLSLWIRIAPMVQLFYFILFFYYDVIETESELHKPRQHFLKRKKMPIPRYKLKKSNVKKSLKKKLYGKLSKKKYQLNMVYRYNFIHLCSECHNPYGVHSEN